MVVENFGKNVQFTPQQVLMPRSEEELLQILGSHKGRRIRVAGRLHSWSELVETDDALIDLKLLDSVQVEHRPEGIWATIGGGCQIKKALADLQRIAGATLPAIGLITEQSIAGAMSTGTHGSGRNCLSHYASEIRIAVYDAISGEPCIRTIRDGVELQAAQCSLGSLGVILSVGLWCRPQYMVEEHFARYRTIDEVLARESEFPLQQFYLVPWSWDYFVQHRREGTTRSRFAWLYRVYCFLTFDLGIHLAVIPLVRTLKIRSLIRFFFRSLLPLGVIRGMKVVDRSDRMLTMRHELFRHIEIEVFVKRSRLSDAIAFSQMLLRHCDRDCNAFTDSIRRELADRGLMERITAIAGTWTYAYILTVRKVLPDTTLMSMSSGGDEPYYALSFITFEQPADRGPFLAFAKCLSDALVALYEGRPHWGKVCPLSKQQVVDLYPRLPEFRRVAGHLDSKGAFRNKWVSGLLFDE